MLQKERELLASDLAGIQTKVKELKAGSPSGSEVQVAESELLNLESDASRIEEKRMNLSNKLATLKSSSESVSSGDTTGS